MGSVIDTERVELNYRCNHVKYLVIYINLICSTFSFILLLFGWIKMFFSKKKNRIYNKFNINNFFFRNYQYNFKIAPIN